MDGDPGYLPEEYCSLLVFCSRLSKAIQMNILHTIHCWSSLTFEYP